jgi:hypothetical protein
MPAVCQVILVVLSGIKTNVEDVNATSLDVTYTIDEHAGGTLSSPPTASTHT